MSVCDIYSVSHNTNAIYSVAASVAGTAVKRRDTDKRSTCQRIVPLHCGVFVRPA